jgi:hypothetical protein
MPCFLLLSNCQSALLTIRFLRHHTERHQGVRTLTVFLYLNDVEEGGGTEFPTLGITVMVSSRSYFFLSPYTSANYLFHRAWLHSYSQRRAKLSSGHLCLMKIPTRRTSEPSTGLCQLKRVSSTEQMRGSINATSRRLWHEDAFRSLFKYFSQSNAHALVSFNS